MRVMVTGATGLIGTALIAKLNSSGHQTGRLLRSGTKAGADILWNPEKRTIDLDGLEGVDAVVHLAGESIASGRWSPERKERIRQSRVQGTTFLSESLAQLQHPPKVLLSASAIGYYGDRGSELLTEQSSPGTGFLPDVCRAWESATQAATVKGIRVVNLRTGIVLSTRGGALATMLTPFRMGVGGKVGTGQQYMSWISLNDLCRVAVHCIEAEPLQGAVNAVSPSPVTNAEFTKALGKALHRPTIFPLPEVAARLAFGEMADALLLASARVLPKRLENSGFAFRDPDLAPTLKQILREGI